MRQPSPLAASDDIISLTSHSQPDLSHQAEGHGLTLSAGINLSGPIPDLPVGSSQILQAPEATGANPGRLDSTGVSLSGGLGSHPADKGGAPSRPVGRPASMQPAALIRAAREKAAAMAAAAADAAGSRPAASFQQAPPQVQPIHATPFSNPAQPAQPTHPAQKPSGNEPLADGSTFSESKASIPAAFGGLPDMAATVKSEIAGLQFPPSGIKQEASSMQQEPASGIQLAADEKDVGISLGGSQPQSIFDQSVFKQEDLEEGTEDPAGDAQGEEGKGGAMENLPPVNTERPAASGSSTEKKGSQGLEQKPSIPGPAPPAGSPSASAARRVPGPRPPPGAPPPRPHAPGES